MCENILGGGGGVGVRTNKEARYSCFTFSFVDVSANLHAEELLCASASLPEEACGVAFVHEDDGIVLVCQSLDRN